MRKPDWLRAALHHTPAFASVRKLLEEKNLHTVCQSARCPNQAECWSRATATFMILGEVCTRACRFCAVATGRPLPPESGEARRVAESVAALKLRYVVLTSVTRDDLPDGGAAHWAQVISAVHALCPQCFVDVLIPDFRGEQAALDTVLAARPDLVSHNLETVERLQKPIRLRANYADSLGVLERARKAGFHTKSGLMLGLGETEEEIAKTLADLRAIDTEVLTLGQYLRPRPENAPVARWVEPAEFARWKARALEMGFKAVEAGPLVRSSYRADQARERLG